MWNRQKCRWCKCLVSRLHCKFLDIYRCSSDYECNLNYTEIWMQCSTFLDGSAPCAGCAMHMGNHSGNQTTNSSVVDQTHKSNQSMHSNGVNHTHHHNETAQSSESGAVSYVLTGSLFPIIFTIVVRHMMSFWWPWKFTNGFSNQAQLLKFPFFFRCIYTFILRRTTICEYVVWYIMFKFHG